MFWSEPDEEEEALLCSPALMARRASESWIVAPPVEVRKGPKVNVYSRIDQHFWAFGDPRSIRGIRFQGQRIDDFSRARSTRPCTANVTFMRPTLDSGIVPDDLFLTSSSAMPVAAMTLQRKKSLPDVAQGIQLTATAPLSREEVSVLSSMRREEIRRQIDERERLRANPLLYLVSPQVKVRLVLPATAGNAGALHQHILSPDVLQVADVAASQ
uniref:Uncharacterized protein n=1 Tax=Vespula pensylvanica TaxID=30213 RepID=A0A834P6T7_VESPE|nr:hypothetical protein H0235_004212 [Vespula pensylvanica]